MGVSRTCRLVEGSLVALFFVQAARVALARLLSMTSAALHGSPVDSLLVNAHVFLFAALILPWFAPRVRVALPETLSVSAIAVALARIVLAVQVPSVQVYAAIAVLGAGGVYLASLLRANWRSWLTSLVVGLTLDQVLRARDTFDLSIRAWIEVPVGGSQLAVPWLAVQVALSALLVVVSRLARRNARREPYEPAFLSVWGGLAFGAFLALEMIVLAMPNVMAYWSGVAYAGLVPWLLLATALPLVPGVRYLMGETVAMFAERLRGWVWMLLLMLLVVAGNRLSGLGAAGALTVAQFMAILLLWWVPMPAEPTEVEQVGPSLSLGLLAFIILVYAYSLTFDYGSGLPWLRDQGILVILLAVVLLGLPRLLWREIDPWLVRATVPRGVAIVFVAPVFVFGLILSSLNGLDAPLPARSTLRIATYNVNSGYDGSGRFQLELTARTIEAALADVVLLQEIDGGRPLSYGVDEVHFLARRLGMEAAFAPTVEQVHGLAILSRWPLQDEASILLPGPDGQLGVLEVTLAGGPEDVQPVRLASVRLAPAASEEERVQRLGMVLGFVGDSSTLVLGGDLGVPPEDDTYKQLMLSGFVDPDAVLGIERGYTVPASNPSARHDYILLRGLEPLDSRQVDSTASDHRLVVVEVGWPQP